MQIGRRAIAALLATVVVVALAGCAPKNGGGKDVARAVVDYHAGDFSRAQQRLKPLAEKTDESFVLNNLRLGSAYLIDYKLDDAEAAFLRAYEVMNSVGVNDGGRSMGAVLVDEKIKVWKGEPFERAMANFYLGLIYYMRHDYANARAAFENALFKLRDYDHGKDQRKSERIESNFVLATIMLAKSWQRLGRDDLARENFRAAYELRPELQPLCDYSWNESSNVLLVVDYDYGPRKVTEFDGSIVGFAPTPSQVGGIARPRVIVDGRAVDVDEVNKPPLDLLALAQDRRWQSIDTIRAVKSGIGTGLIAGGAIMGVKGAGESGSRQRTDLMVAAGLIGTGLLLKATSQADIRQWEMLPRTTFVLPLRLEPGEHKVTVEFPGDRALRQTWRGLVAPPRGEATYYFRMQRWNEGPFDWPPPTMASIDSHPPRDDHEVRVAP